MLIKALAGDSADCVAGYRDIGPIRAGRLAASPTLLREHLDREGDGVFRRNLALIDMSLNPFTLSNLLYVGKVLASRPVFDLKRLRQLELQYKIHGLMTEYAEIAAPFKLLVTRVE